MRGSKVVVGLTALTILPADPVQPKEGDLRVWWIPQVPGKPFKVPVKDIEQAKLLHNTLADYDRFQYDNRIKPDYANTGGLEVFEDGEWCEWHDPESDLDLSELMRM